MFTVTDCSRILGTKTNVGLTVTVVVNFLGRVSFTGLSSCWFFYNMDIQFIIAILIVTTKYADIPRDLYKINVLSNVFLILCCFPV